MAMIHRSKQLHYGIRACSMLNLVSLPVRPCFKNFRSFVANQIGADSFNVPVFSLVEGATKNSFARKFHACRVLNFQEQLRDQQTLESFYTFVRSTFGKLQGSNYRWLNKNVVYKQDFNEDGVFLIVTGAFVENPLLSYRDQLQMIEKVKLLQQRYPKLQVFGFENFCSVSCRATENILTKTIEEEYVTFPVLLSERQFPEISNQPCYWLHEGFENQFLHFDWNVDAEIVANDIEKFKLFPSCNVVDVKDLNSYGIRQADVTKGYYACPSFRNLFLHYPGCISVDKYGERIFLSDSNHHRIIISDVDGKILDCIGSSPGFEDSVFHSAELLRPAGSVYNENDDCLYFADSENHAIRRADMTRRVVETIYPLSDRKNGGICNWIMEKIGIKRERSKDMGNFDPNSITFPWHLIMLGDDLLVFNRSLESSWILNKEMGQIKSIIKGFPNVMEAYREMIFEKLSPQKELANWYSQEPNVDGLLDDSQFAKYISSTAELKNYFLVCDTAGQKILQYNKKSRDIVDFQFSDFGILGMPYWLAYPTEKVVPSVNAYGLDDAYLEHFSILPGMCDIVVNIGIPEGTKLVSPLNEDCIWRQARGSAAEISDLDKNVESTEKVGVAQQWYDELDDLATPNASEFSSDQEEESSPTTEVNRDENMVCIRCVVNTSPGTSEVIVSAVLYLKRDEDTSDLRPNIPGGKHHAFMKPVHVRIKLECADHPLRPNSGDIISTKSNLEVNISL